MHRREINHYSLSLITLIPSKPQDVPNELTQDPTEDSFPLRIYKSSRASSSLPWGPMTGTLRKNMPASLPNRSLFDRMSGAGLVMVTGPRPPQGRSEYVPHRP